MLTDAIDGIKMLVVGIPIKILSTLLSDLADIQLLIPKRHKLKKGDAWERIYVAVSRKLENKHRNSPYPYTTWA